MPALPPNTSARRAAIFRRVGRAIARARKAAGIVQTGLARALGVSAATIQNWEGGWRLPSLAHRKRLVELLGLDPKALACDRDECPSCGRRYE
jgi:transcriptional regulator with XRE-family HTH domain